MSNVYVSFNGKTIEVSKFTTYYDISRRFDVPYVIGVEVNNKVASLYDRVYHDCELKFLDNNCVDGNRIYVAGLKMLFEYAVKKAYPKIKVSFLYSLPHTIIARLDNDKYLSSSEVSIIKREMSNIVISNIQIEKLVINNYDIIKYYSDINDSVKLANIQNISDNTAVLYRMNDFVNYYYSEMPYSTGTINKFELKSIGRNLIALSFPSEYDNGQIREYVNYDNVIDTYEEGRRWLQTMDVSYINNINKCVVEGRINNFVKSAELNFNLEINETAKYIANNGNIKCVMISGPSSSGKTTVTKRIANYFEIYGLDPIVISLDDYFKERVDTPKDENGKYDFECLQALDIEYLCKDIKTLFQGKPINLPRFNFKTGCKELTSKVIKLKTNSIILFEGLHAINDELLPMIPNDKKYKIYVSPYIPVCLDSHNYISASDLCLIRRLIRDFRTRGYSVESTIERNDSVRRGEDKYIIPYIPQANKIINTSLPYEVGVLKVFVEPILYSVGLNSPYYNEARRLLNFLKHFFTINSEFVPNDSILREFIGGNLDD